jgi:hypothetical protein
MKKAIRVLGTDFRLICNRTQKQMGAAGLCTFKHPSIEIAKDLSNRVQRSTLIHEIIEALNGQLELNLPHPTIVRLETGLFSVCEDNGIDVGVMLSTKRNRKKNNETHAP